MKKKEQATKQIFDSSPTRREFLIASAFAVCGLSLSERVGAKIITEDKRAAKSQPMRAVPTTQKVVIAKDDVWYFGFTGVAESKGVLVASYLKSDQHLRTKTDIMTARSVDGGRTWQDHRSIAHLNIFDHEAIWVAPELNSLPDGRLILICDKGQRKPGQNLPVLSKWQTKERGMSNWIFLSSDQGLTWTEPYKTDDVGGEPERVHELSNGAWIYTRTDSRPTTAIKNPVEPWGANYYRSTAVFSDDKGKTWNRTAVIVDDPLVGDCEVGICEYAPGKIVALTRVGDANSQFGQPSRAVYSSDYGKTWGKPVLMPFNGQRPIPGLLRSGKMLVTFRNCWGTTGSYAFLFDPKEKFAYQPNSFIWNESRCQLNNDAMEIKTVDGTRDAVQFSLYPVEDDDSVVEMTAEFAVKEADREGCLISAGAWVRFTPNRIELADRPAEGFAFDTTGFHRYRFVNRNKRLQVFVDGKLRLETKTDGIHTRYVRFGNRHGERLQTVRNSADVINSEQVKSNSQTPTGTAKESVDSRQTSRITPLRGAHYENNASHTLWRTIAAKVTNRRDHSIDWTWTAKSGKFPDQLRRDRFILLDRAGTFVPGDSGYSGWTETKDGGIVIVDYTTGTDGSYPPDVFAYLVTERDLT